MAKCSSFFLLSLYAERSNRLFPSRHCGPKACGGHSYCHYSTLSLRGRDSALYGRGNLIYSIQSLRAKRGNRLFNLRRCEYPSQCFIQRALTAIASVAKDKCTPSQGRKRKSCHCEAVTQSYTTVAISFIPFSHCERSVAISCHSISHCEAVTQSYTAVAISLIPHISHCERSVAISGHSNSHCEEACLLPTKQSPLWLFLFIVILPRLLFVILTRFLQTISLLLFVFVPLM